MFVLFEQRQTTSETMTRFVGSFNKKALAQQAAKAACNKKSREYVKRDRHFNYKRRDGNEWMEWLDVVYPLCTVSYTWMIFDTDAPQVVRSRYFG